MSKELKVNFSQEQLAQIDQHLRTKWRNPCPMCGERRWSPHAYAIVPLSPNSRNIVIGGLVLSNVALVCENCGYTALLNLVVAGLVPRE